MDTETQGETGSDTDTSQTKLKSKKHHQEPGRGKKGAPRVSEGAGCLQDLDLRFPASRTMAESLSVVSTTQLVVLSASSPTPGLLFVCFLILLVKKHIFKRAADPTDVSMSPLQKLINRKNATQEPLRAAPYLVFFKAVVGPFGRRKVIRTHHAHCAAGSWLQGLPGSYLLNSRATPNCQGFENPGCVLQDSDG